MHSFTKLLMVWQLKQKTVCSATAATHLSGTCEGHLVHIHVGGDCCPCAGPIPWDDIHHSSREAGLSHQLGHIQASEGCLLCQLHYNRVALRHRKEKKCKKHIKVHSNKALYIQLNINTTYL